MTLSMDITILYGLSVIYCRLNVNSLYISSPEKGLFIWWLLSKMCHLSPLYNFWPKECLNKNVSSWFSILHAEGIFRPQSLCEKKVGKREGMERKEIYRNKCQKSLYVTAVCLKACVRNKRHIQGKFSRYFPIWAFFHVPCNLASFSRF